MQVRIIPNAFHQISDHFKTQEICNKVVEVDPWQLKDVPNHFKTQEMCNKAMRYYPFSLQFVPDWFVTQQQIDVWYDDNYVYDDEIIEWYDGCKARKAQKAKIKEEFSPIAWHPSRRWDWIDVFLKMKKQKQKNCGHKHGPFLCLVTRYKKFFDPKRNKDKRCLLC